MSTPAGWGEADADSPRTYQPTPYDLFLTDDPEATWDQLQAEPDTGPEASL